MNGQDKKEFLEKLVFNFEQYPQYHSIKCDAAWNENADSQDETGRLCTCGLTEAMLDSMPFDVIESLIAKRVAEAKAEKAVVIHSQLLADIAELQRRLDVLVREVAEVSKG